MRFSHLHSGHSGVGRRQLRLRRRRHGHAGVRRLLADDRRLGLDQRQRLHAVGLLRPRRVRLRPGRRGRRRDMGAERQRQHHLRKRHELHAGRQRRPRLHRQPEQRRDRRPNRHLFRIRELWRRLLLGRLRAFQRHGAVGRGHGHGVGFRQLGLRLRHAGLHEHRRDLAAGDRNRARPRRRTPPTGTTRPPAATAAPTPTA